MSSGRRLGKPSNENPQETATFDAGESSVTRPHFAEWTPGSSLSVPQPKDIIKGQNIGLCG